MRFPKPEFIPTNTKNGEQLAIYQAGPADGVPLLLIHGWPEMAYSWAHQIYALAEAGYRVIAPDSRGFGHSTCPKDPSGYRIDKICDDLEAILDHLNIEKSVLCGHDWGGIIVWNAARIIEHRVSGVIGICTPHMPRAPIDPMQIFEQRHGKDHYFVAFKEIGAAEAVFEQDPKAFFRMMFNKPRPGAKPSSGMYYLVKRFQQYLDAGAPRIGVPIMSDEDIEVYAGAYQKSGFHGGINYYRNTTPNWEYSANMVETISQPSLMLSAELDTFLPPSMADPMEKLVGDLERVTIKDCGHWAMWEQPEAINAAMIDWLGRRF